LSVRRGTGRKTYPSKSDRRRLRTSPITAWRARRAFAPCTSAFGGGRGGTATRSQLQQAGASARALAAASRAASTARKGQGSTAASQPGSERDAWLGRHGRN